MDTDDILERVQSDTLERLKATPRLAGVSMIAEDGGSLESKVETLLTKVGTNRPRIGLCFIVLRAEVESAEESLPGPRFRVRQPIQVVEHPMLNRGAKGTRIRCGTASLRALRSLHLATIGGFTIYADKKPIIPFGQVPDGFISNIVSVMYHPPHEVAPKPGGVHPDIDEAGRVILTTAGDAQIYWSQDGSYPRQWAGESNLYSEPIGPLPAGTLIRAAAYLPDTNPGDVLEFFIRE